MASACVKSIGVSPENFPTYGWLSPRTSFSHEYSEVKPEKKASDAPEASDPAKDFGDFEFRLDDSATMLPADELFFDGKLVPLQMTAARPAATECVSSPEVRKSCSTISCDPYLQSPRAPRCSVRWRELLGFRKNKPEINAKAATSPSNPTTSFSTSSSPNTAKSIRQFLHRKSMSKDSDCESSSLSISSSRLSLSSSSSGHDHDDLPRLSLDTDNKPSQSQISFHRSSSSCPNQPPRHHRVRSTKPRMVPASVEENPISRVILSADSPRMSSSGKIVFQSLGRSSSSPSSFNGGPRYRHRGMERSYSANVRVTPLLNVPVCSLRGSSKSGVFGFGQKKKDGKNTSIATGTVTSGTGGRVIRR
ncbi:hypothetical protein V2J09_020057 [Rumex salicifolius]